MNTTEERSWRAIASLKGIGPKTLWSIADYLEREKKTASWLIQNPDSLKILVGGRFNNLGQITETNVSPNFDEDVKVLYPLHSHFPKRVKSLQANLPLPAILYAKGNTTLANVASVAIEGARQADSNAIEIAEKIATQLVGNKINIVSGYAKGIDTTAHLAALKSKGTTTIVLSEGINRYRPKQDFMPLVTLENTLVVSQFEPESQWASHYAMTRNKLIAALSNAVVVIVSGPERDAEGRMSGTFDAAMSATRMGVPTFVVSPSVLQGQGDGNRELIKKGCTEWIPSQGINEILKAINTDSSATPKKKSPIPDLFQKSGDA